MFLLMLAMLFSSVAMAIPIYFVNQTGQPIANSTVLVYVNGTSTAYTTNSTGAINYTLLANTTYLFVAEQNGTYYLFVNNTTGVNLTALTSMTLNASGFNYTKINVSVCNMTMNATLYYVTLPEDKVKVDVPSTIYTQNVSNITIMFPENMTMGHTKYKFNYVEVNGVKYNTTNVTVASDTNNNVTVYYVAQLSYLYVLLFIALIVVLCLIAYKLTRGPAAKSMGIRTKYYRRKY